MGDTRRGCALAVFGRPATPGRTKTRLIPVLGEEGAARLYRGFVRDVLSQVREVGGLDCEFWSSTDPDHADLDFLPPDLPRRSQPDVDLGGRMYAALDRGLGRCAASVVLGSDAPTLPASYLRLAMTRLLHPDGADIILGPASDGGYYLIGARSLHPDLFAGVRFSTRHTLADTSRAARGLGLSVGLLPPWYDVDDGRDLTLLRTELSLEPERASHTSAALDELATPCP